MNYIKIQKITSTLDYLKNGQPLFGCGLGRPAAQAPSLEGERNVLDGGIRFRRDKSVDVWRMGSRNSESLSDKCVCHSNHGEFSGFAMLPQTLVTLVASLVVLASRPCRDI